MHSPLHLHSQDFWYIIVQYCQPSFCVETGGAYSRLLKHLVLKTEREVCLDFEKQETEDYQRGGGKENLELMTHSCHSVVEGRQM